MAVPKNATLHRNAPLKSGIILGVSPSSDPTFDVEIARATSGVYETIGRLSPQGNGIPVSFTDILPVTTGAFTYKARAVKEGYLAGDYTAIVEARPVSLPEIPPPITPLTGKGIGAPLFISTGAPPQYGRANLQQYYQTDLQARMFEFTSTAIAATYSATPFILYPNSTAARKFYWGSRLPEESENVQIQFSYSRASTVGTLRFRFGKEFPALSWFVDYTATGTAGTFSKSFTSGFDIPLNYGAYCQVDITSTSGSTASVTLIGVDFTYFKPTVAVAV